LANLLVRLANVCSQLFYANGLPREPRLICRLRISLNLAQAGMAAYGGYLVHRAPCLS